MFGSMGLFDNVAFPFAEHRRRTSPRSATSSWTRWSSSVSSVPRTSFPVRSPAACASARPRPRPGARPGDPARRRARLRSRPGADGLHHTAVPPPRRADRRDVPDRVATTSPLPRRARQHRPARRQSTWPCSAPAWRCCSPARSRRRPTLNAERVGLIRMRAEEKDADQLAAEKDIEMPPLPPIPRQIETSDGRPRRAAREPGSWCRENGVTPPPGSFAENMALTGSGSGGSE